MYIRSKTQADKAFYDWASSVGLTWGAGFLLVMPFLGFANVYAMKSAAPANPSGASVYSSSYERLTSGDSFTSTLLWVNLIMVVLLFVLSNLAMYMGAGRHPDRGGRYRIQFFGLVAALAGLYSIMPPAAFPVFWVRYVAMLVMILATVGAFVTYVRGRMRFRYGSPGAGYRVVLLALGVIAASTALGMGFMKSNSRVPYTVYNQPDYTVQSQRPPGGFGR
jgi:hypothetical protein